MGFAAVCFLAVSSGVHPAECRAVRTSDLGFRTSDFLCHPFIANSLKQYSPIHPKGSTGMSPGKFAHESFQRSLGVWVREVSLPQEPGRDGFHSVPGFSRPAEGEIRDAVEHVPTGFMGSKHEFWSRGILPTGARKNGTASINADDRHAWTVSEKRRYRIKGKGVSSGYWRTVKDCFRQAA